MQIGCKIGGVCELAASGSRLCNTLQFYGGISQCCCVTPLCVCCWVWGVVCVLLCGGGCVCVCGCVVWWCGGGGGGLLTPMPCGSWQVACLTSPSSLSG